MRKITSDKHFDSLILCEVGVKPWENGVWIDVLLKVSQEISENKALFPSPVCSHPEPSISLLIGNIRLCTNLVT